eukprot:4360881-Prymnesium_polylepis.1
MVRMMLYGLAHGKLMSPLQLATRPTTSPWAGTPPTPAFTPPPAPPPPPPAPPTTTSNRAMRHKPAARLWRCWP